MDAVKSRSFVAAASVFPFGNVAVIVFDTDYRYLRFNLRAQCPHTHTRMHACTLFQIMLYAHRLTGFKNEQRQKWHLQINTLLFNIKTMYSITSQMHRTNCTMAGTNINYAFERGTLIYKI